MIDDCDRNRKRPGKGCSLFYERSYHQRGQSITEVIIVVCLIAVAGIIAFMLFGDNLRKQFGKSGNAVGGKSAGLVGDTTTNDKIAKERDLSNFSDDMDALEQPPVPPPPPPPPMAEDPMGAQVRHHIGDGLYGSSAGGGNLVNEGASLNIGFEVTQEMIDYANETTGGFVYLHCEGAGVNYFGSNFGNSATINGSTVGFLQNGENTFALNLNDIGAGSHDLGFNAYDYSGGRGSLDDIEVDGICIDYSREFVSGLSGG